MKPISNLTTEKITVNFIVNGKGQLTPNVKLCFTTPHGVTLKSPIYKKGLFMRPIETRATVIDQARHTTPLVATTTE